MNVTDRKLNEMMDKEVDEFIKNSVEDYTEDKIVSIKKSIALLHDIAGSEELTINIKEKIKVGGFEIIMITDGIKQIYNDRFNSSDEYVDIEILNEVFVKIDKAMHIVFNGIEI
jgi:hypothetical protein